VPKDEEKPELVREARELGRHYGWVHAAFVDAYGTESDQGRTLDEIKDGMRPLYYDGHRERWSFSDGFDEGMEAFENDQREDCEEQEV
jgi:hypothetical protein